MKSIKGVFYIASVIIPIFLSGCAGTNAASMLSRRLDLASLNTRLETKTNDLSVGGECPGIKSLKVINGETRTEKYCIDATMGCRWYVIPKDFTDLIVKYIESKLIASNVNLSKGLDNQIIISLDELKLTEGFSFGSYCKIKIQIPDINYTNTYVAESGSGLGDLAAAHVIHLAIDNFFKDPVFQNYVRCHQDRS